MAKVHFKSYTPNQIVLFPQQIDKDIAAADLVRPVNALIDSLDLSKIYEFYSSDGYSAYHPKLMLKVILYGYMNNIYSCRRIEKLLLRDIHFIWLTGYEHPGFATINCCRNRVEHEINNL